MSYIRLDRQPRFPYEDLSKANAFCFEESIEDLAVLDAHYDQSTGARPYHVGLQVIQEAAMPNIPEHAHTDIQNDIKLYEVASYLVRPGGRRSDMQPEIAACVPPLEHRLKTNFNATREIQNTFEANLPRMTMAVGLIAMRLWDKPIDWDTPNYYVAGAALAFQLESDARRTT